MRPNNSRPLASGPLSHGSCHSWRLRLLTLSPGPLVGSLQPWLRRLKPGLYTAEHSLLFLPLTLTSSSPAPLWPFHRPCWVSWEHTSYLWLGDSSSGQPSSLILGLRLTCLFAPDFSYPTTTRHFSSDFEMSPTYFLALVMLVMFWAILVTNPFFPHIT